MLAVSVAFRAREWARTRNVQQLVRVFSVLSNSFFLSQPQYVLLRRVMLIPPSSGRATVPGSDFGGLWPQPNLR